MRRRYAFVPLTLALLMFCATGCDADRPAEDGVPPETEPETVQDAQQNVGEPAPGPTIPAQSVGEVRVESLESEEDGKSFRLTFSQPVSLGCLDNILAAEPAEPFLFETPGPLVNVTAFGAVTDDDQDDIVPLQAAVDEVKSGGVVYFPKGEYLLSKCLMFYSNQTLYFEPGAVLKIIDPYNREIGSSQSLLANDMDGTVGGYDTVKNVNIIGAVFDGNADIDYSNVMLSTCHVENLNMLNCTFRNGHSIHYYECNSGKNIRIVGCVFEDSFRNGEAKDEYLQIDRAGSGSYGTKYSVLGKHEYYMDNTPCEDILISGCVFDCTNSQVPAIGNHAAARHRNIVVQNCVFTGGNPERGMIAFKGGVKGASFINNRFSGCSLGIDCVGKNTENVAVYESNAFANVDLPLQEGMTFVQGPGNPLPCPQAVKAAEAVWPEEGGGTTVRITFPEELSENARLVLLAGAFVDSQGSFLASDGSAHALATALPPGF